MDFLSQYNAYQFSRTTTDFTKAGGQLIDSGSPKTSMGGAFILLNAQLKGNPPCRLRLYSDATSRDTDANRSWTNFNVSESVALIADIVLTDTNTVTFDPPIIGNTFSGGDVYYHLSASSTPLTASMLYSRPVSEVPLAEVTRSFDTQSQDGALLIADLMFDSASFQYPLVPVLEGYTWTKENYAVGTNQVGYILENRSGGATNITASLYIYSTED